jgi:hypothetical protein
MIAQFSTVRSRKKSVNDDVKQSSDKEQNIIKSRNRNEAKEGTEEGTNQQVQSEAQNLYRSSNHPIVQLLEE